MVSDLKPLKVMRVGGKWKLIDFDAAVPLWEKKGDGANERARAKAKAGAKVSTAFVPPELIHVPSPRSGTPAVVITKTGDIPEAADTVPERRTAQVKTYRADEKTGLPVTAGLDYELLGAHVSFDMWSLGCVLYHLCTGFPLFSANQEDNLGEKGLLELARWNDTAKAEKLSLVTDRFARNLLSQLLDDKTRPNSMSRCSPTLS